MNGTYKLGPGITAMAIVDLGSSDGSIAATLSGRGVCGVIVRYSDPFNYITLKRVSLYGVWNLEKVVGGETTRLTYLAASPTSTRAGPCGWPVRCSPCGSSSAC